MIGNIMKSSEYPLGTKLEGTVSAIEKSGYDQYIHLVDVKINDIASPSIWMRATRTLGEFIDAQGYNAYTVVGHMLYMVKQEKMLIGYNGVYHKASFFVPIRIN
jgi:hypothetical protein